MLKPIGDKVVIKRDEVSTMSAGGIALPESAQDKPREGLVIAAGPGKVEPGVGRVPLLVKEGDRVVFAAYAGTKLVYEGVELLAMTEDDVIAVLGESEE